MISKTTKTINIHLFSYLLFGFTCMYVSVYAAPVFPYATALHLRTKHNVCLDWTRDFANDNINWVVPTASRGVSQGDLLRPLRWFVCYCWSCWCDPFPRALPRQGTDAGLGGAAATAAYNIVSLVTLAGSWESFNCIRDDITQSVIVVNTKAFILQNDT